MVAYTTTYNLKKPTVADDEDVWGGYLNDSMDIIDNVLDGTVPVTGIDINSGTLDNVVIGGATANSGTFTVLSATTSLGVTGNITVSGTVDGVDIATRDAVLTSTTTTANAALPKAGGTMTGAITFATGQTFDGRDVSADGAKLDGIESGATADQTASEILTLIKTVDGAGSGLDADTLDGVSSGSFLRSDAADTVTGLITIDRTGEALGIGDGSLDSADAYIRMGNGTLDWRLKYVGSTSGTDGNEFRIESGNTGDYLQFDHDGNFQRYDGTSTYTIWDSGNDGSGSGLDADTLDGVQGSSYLRSDADDTFSGNLTLSKDGQDVLNFSANDTNDARGISFNNRTALSADYNDGWLRLNQLSEFTNGVYTPSTFLFGGNVDVAANIRHSGDTDTYINFNTNEINLYTGGSREVTINSTGVRLGDTGNGYFQPVSGQYGSIQIDGGAHGGWEGYSIGGRSVFMHNNSTTTGIYNDVENAWLFKATHNGKSELYFNGVSKLDTLSDGVSINGNLYADGSVAEDYDALSGTSVTCNVDNAGAFSLTMTGNTTFTFSGAANNWSQGFVLQLTGNGGTVTWPSSVDWAGGTAPDAPASGETDIYVFWTRNGGTTWYGVQSIDAAA